jgi:acetoin utilization deacetylase AcuC-like enzyme
MGATGSKTGFVYDPQFLEHDTGPGHPERADRLRAVVNHLEKTGLWNKLKHLGTHPAAEEWILRVHAFQHLKFVREACEQGIGILDQGDTRACARSFEVALSAVRGVLSGVDAVMNGLVQNVFCAVRPPGHHAERNTVMGFCLFNNAAIASRYAQQKYGIEKVAIVDWDVHHGNGTQEIFYDDSSVFYLSLHQYPFYPGTGSRSETGTGKGEGFTLNFPMRAGSGEEDYLAAFRQEIVPALDAYRPDLIIVSAGFDAHRNDPLANINLTEGSFTKMTEIVRSSAVKHAKGRIVSVLEGGYDLQALAKSVEAHVKKLME